MGITTQAWISYKELDMLTKLSDKDHGSLRAENVKRFVGLIHSYTAYASHLDKIYPKVKISYAAKMKLEVEFLLLRPKNEEFEGFLDWAKISERICNTPASEKFTRI
jgi:hypothetical protein